MPLAGNPQQARSMHGGGIERLRHGANSLSCGRSRPGQLGNMGRGPGMDAVDVAGTGRFADGSRSDRVFAFACAAFAKTAESSVNALSACAGRIFSFL